MDLCGKNVVYIGGFGGIGFATCKILATKGVKNLIVLDLSLNAKSMQELKTLNSNTHFIAFDITIDLPTMRKAFSSILKQFKRVDVVVNGAGIYRESMIGQTIAVNLHGPINVAVALMELCDKRFGGAGDLTVVNITSRLAIMPNGYTAIYCSTKAGLLMFTQSCADFYEESGVSFIAICPGLTDTAILLTLDSFMIAQQRLTDLCGETQKQSPEQCGSNIVKAIEMNRNGSVWLLVNGEMNLADFKEIWKSNI